MSHIYGTAKLAYNGETRHVSLLLDLSDYCFVARHADADTFRSMSEFQRLFERNGVTLHEVSLSTPNGLLEAVKIDDLQITNYTGGGASVHSDSILNRSFQLTGDGSGIVTLQLRPVGSALVEFDYSPTAGRGSEILYGSNALFLAPINTIVNGVTYNVAAERRLMTLTSPALLWNDESRFRLSLSLLQGIPIALLAAYESNRARIHLTRPRAYQAGHTIYEANGDVEMMFKHILQFVMSLPVDEFRHWQKATAFLLEGKSSYAPLDIRVINLFVFIEMFDGSATLSANTVSPMLGITIADAKLLCEVRNRLVHQKHGLEDAIVEAQAHLASKDPAFALTAFVNTTSRTRAVHFAFRLCERLNFFIAQQIGWSGPWNAYRHLLT